MASPGNKLSAFRDCPWFSPYPPPCPPRRCGELLLLSPLPLYTPEYRELSVRDEVAEGSEETECRPSLDGTDIFGEGRYLRGRGRRMAKDADMRFVGATTKRGYVYILLVDL
jgi:hypothetical protein